MGKIKKIDRKEYEGRFDKGSLLGKQLDKLDELVEEWNNHEEWHRRFFDKYNKAEEMTKYEDKE